MARRFKGNSGTGNYALKALGQIIGFLLGIWVFDKILGIILAQVGDCSYLSGNAVPAYGETAGDYVCYWAANASGSQYGTADNVHWGVFGDGIAFIKDILPVIAILGAFYIIFRTLRKMGLV